MKGSRPDRKGGRVVPGFAPPVFPRIVEPVDGLPVFAELHEPVDAVVRVVAVQVLLLHATRGPRRPEAPRGPLDRALRTELDVIIIQVPAPAPPTAFSKFRYRLAALDRDLPRIAFLLLDSPRPRF